MDNSFCCVPQCTSLGSHMPRPSFHRFPSAKENNGRRRLQWIAKLRIGKEVTPRMVVCGKHFKSSDFFPATGGDNGLKRRKLKRNAVPSCNLPTSPEYAEDDEDKINLGKTKKSKSNKKVPVIEKLTLETREPICLDEDSHVSTEDKIPSNSINVVCEEHMDTSFCVDQLNVTEPSFSAVDANVIEETSKNLEKHTENGTTLNLPVKFTENSKFDYSVFKSLPGDSKETLTQKLDSMISVNAVLQKKVEFFQSKCEIYEKEVNIMKGVIDNLKLINSATFEN